MPLAVSDHLYMYNFSGVVSEYISYEQSPLQRNKLINVWQKYKIWTGFEPGTPGPKANTITTELKRIPKSP